MIITGLMDNPGYMSWENLKEMAGSGFVTVYNHTWSHYSLGAGPDEKVITEVTTARQQITDHFGQAFPLLSYPYGPTNAHLIKILLDNGFVAGFTTYPGTRQCDSILMALRRTRIGNAPLSAYGL